MKKLIVATKNTGKAEEFRVFLGKLGIEAVSLLDLEEHVPDIAETGTTFEENAALKAETIAEKFNLPVVADDSGLMVDVLNGKPGVHSARFAGENKNDLANLTKVLHGMDGVAKDKRSGRFVCVLAVARPNEPTIVKSGTCEGTIAQVPRGDNGFGYDPIFYPTGYNKTMAELLPEEKNKISHRHNALVQLEEWLHTVL